MSDQPRRPRRRLTRRRTITTTDRTTLKDLHQGLLKGHIYDASGARQSDQFIKTTKEIAEFVGRTYKYGGDIRLSVETLTIPIMTPTLDYEEGAGRTAIRIWEKSVDEHVRRMSQPTENIKTLYSLVWGQCNDVVRQKAESHDLFAATSATGDGLALLTILKGISFQFQSQKYVGHSIHEALKRYYNCSHAASLPRRHTWSISKTLLTSSLTVGGPSPDTPDSRR